MLTLIAKKFVSLRHESGMPISQPSRKMIEPPEQPMTAEFRKTPP